MSRLLETLVLLYSAPTWRDESTSMGTRMNRINLGDKAKDTVSGFTGVAIARTEWLNGCVRVSLAPDKLSKEGSLQKDETFDEPQLALVKRAAVKCGARPENGGPIPRPMQAATPSRR